MGDDTMTTARTGGRPVIDRAKHNLMLQELAARFPSVFSIDMRVVRPLKVGVHQDLERELQGSPLGDPAIIQAFLDRYTRLYAYNAAVAAGGQRYGLDGTPHGAISATQAQIAAGRAKGAQRRRKLANTAGRARTQH